MAKFTAFERRLLPIVRKWHGVIPTWAVREHGIDSSQLRHWAASNPDVEHPQRGIYIWFTDDPKTDYEYTNLAMRLAEGGPDAAFWGPTVIQLAGLGDWASPTLHIATYGRKPKTRGIHWHHDTGFRRERLHGLPVQPLKDAITDGLRYMDEDQRDKVLTDAAGLGLIDGRVSNGTI